MHFWGMPFSHLDSQGRPAMVDISSKEATAREAEAQALVYLPEEVLRHSQGDDILGTKGPVFQTAVIAATQAAKKTWDLIPFCHPIALERCTVEIRLRGNEAVVRARISCHQKTGVEMEALTAASVAALTIYDMCKALSRGIVIREVRLLEKTGGKSGPYSSGDGHG
jgi:cyclic pyranopterin phosphate synthase